MDMEKRVEALEAQLAEVRAQLRNAIMVQPPTTCELHTRASRLLDLLAPERGSDGRFVRVGSAFDGGYVLPEAMRFDWVLAFGIGGNCEFEEAMIERDAAVIAFDHTIEFYPADPTTVEWRREGLAPMASAECTTIASAVGEANGRLLVKLDVEGDEWASLDATPTETLTRISCLVVEFHGLDRLLMDADWQRMVAVLERVRSVFALVHVHANNAGPTFRAAGRLIPSFVECTYVHRKIVGLCAPAPGPWPTTLDTPNLPAYPDIDLTNLWASST